MFNVIIGKGRHRVVRMVIVGLVADIQSAHPGFLGGGFEVLGEKLTLLVEVVASALAL
jgi:hypothetical protein